MDTPNLEWLTKQVERASVKRKVSYHHARARGFTAQEATVLQHKSIEVIDQIAAERDAKKQS